MKPPAVNCIVHNVSVAIHLTKVISVFKRLLILFFKLLHWPLFKLFISFLNNFLFKQTTYLNDFLFILMFSFFSLYVLILYKSHTGHISIQLQRNCDGYRNVIEKAQKLFSEMKYQNVICQGKLKNKVKGTRFANKQN